MKDKLMNELARRQLGYIDNDIHWVVTSPGKLEPSTNRLINTAATKAGIKPDQSNLVQGPEAKLMHKTFTDSPSSFSEEQIAPLPKFYRSLLVHLGALREKVLFLNFRSIMELDVDTHTVLVLVEYGFKYPSENRTLERFIQTINPVGIAVDSVNVHVYWVNYRFGQDNYLSRSNLDGTNEVVVSKPLRNTFALFLYLTSSWLYMADRGSGISKSRYDLTEHKTIVKITGRVDCIDIDIEGKKMYWITNHGNMKSAK
ncbi:unnamed protein product [Mytilus coruscus]|uniref:Uncharacterized protein n=1 Tax=Mytilus coruscus TaxID=42192 RepID=A0A6J8BL35_MYTCO|nr:unnamed protein product [Mytilus coruscus]